MIKQLLFVVIILVLAFAPLAYLEYPWVSQEKVERLEFSAFIDLVITPSGHATIYMQYPSATIMDQVFKELKHRGIMKVNLVINSGGGSLLDMFGVIDIMQRYQERGGLIHTHATAFIGSAAIPIYLIGDYRTMGKGCVVMFHPHSLWNKTLADYTYNQIDNDTPTNKTLFGKMSVLWTERYIHIMVQNSHLTAEIASIFITTEDSDKGQFWFSAQEALEMGFVDEII